MSARNWCLFNSYRGRVMGASKMRKYYSGNSNSNIICDAMYPYPGGNA